MGRTRHVWTDKMIELLGTDSDANIAKKIGYSSTTVYKKRKSLGIASAKKKEMETRKEVGGYNRLMPVKKARSDQKLLNRYPGISEHLASKNNTLVGEIYGISRERARQIREQLNIPRPKHNILSKLSDVDQEFIKQNMGKMPDAQLARMLSVAQQTITKYRQSNGIACYRDKMLLKKKELIKTQVHRLGIDSDRQIASDLDGVEQQDVYRFRKNLGIKANKKHSRRWQSLDRETRDFLITKFYKDGYTDEQIAEQIHYAETTVAQIRSQLGLVKWNRTNQASREDDAPESYTDEAAV